MSIEKPGSGVEKKDVSESDFERDMGGLEVKLERILNGKDVNYTEELKKIEDHLVVMKEKYKGKTEILEFLGAVSGWFATIGILVGTLTAMLAKPEMSATAYGTGLSIVFLSEAAAGLFVVDKAKEIKNNIEGLINRSREFTSVYLHKGGATYDARGRLEVTKEQVEWARGMEEDEMKKS